MTRDEMWDCDTAVSAMGVNVPLWIEQEITVSSVAAIVKGGCESGSYMPAVAYNNARQTMNDYGESVLDFILEAIGELPEPNQWNGFPTWSGLCVMYLSCAVELWARSAESELLACY